VSIVECVHTVEVLIMIMITLNRCRSRKMVVGVESEEGKNIK
jgi:hypothetical protein